MNGIAMTINLNQTIAERDLLRRCREGDRNAREELARACLPRVRRTVLLSSGGGPDVDDLVQTAMARIFVGLGSFRGDSGFTTWMDKVTVNTIRQFYRRRPLDLLFSTAEEPAEPAPEKGNPDRQFEGQRMLKRLSTHLAAIRPKKRMAVVLSTAYGYSAREAAELMDCSTETAKKRIQAGRRELLSKMRKDPYLRQALMEMAQ